jgi:hypothetical protein
VIHQSALEATNRCLQDLDGLVPSKIRLPHLELLRIDGNQRILDALDFEDSEVVDLVYSGDLRGQLNPAVLPKKLDSLRLGAFYFISKPPQPYLLADLTTLEFGDTTIEHPLQAYISFPKLRYLELWNVSLRLPEDNSDQNANGSSTPPPNQSFLMEAPELETIAIKDMTIGSDLVAVLQKCPQLDTVIIEFCKADSFMPSFLSSLSNEEAFPSLDTLYIRFSWPRYSDISFDEFVTQCDAERPDIDISRDGDYYKRSYPITSS